MTDATDTLQTNTPDSAPIAKTKRRRPAAAGANLALLDQLAALHPDLFGTVFQPLKRGIFQDLLDAHPGLFTSEALKAALAQHTRDGRYLAAVAEGRPRHDLAGRAVEAMAPEHVHHALLELFRRRQARSRDDLRPTLRKRMAQAFVRSGLAAQAYAALVHCRDEAANQLLAEALLEVRASGAKDEALLRAFEGGAHSVEAFAEMYAMEPRSAGQALERARRARAVAASAAVAPTGSAGMLAPDRTGADGGAPE